MNQRHITAAPSQVCFRLHACVSNIMNRNGTWQISLLPPIVCLCWGCWTVHHRPASPRCWALWQGRLSQCYWDSVSEWRLRDPGLGDFWTAAGASFIDKLPWRAAVKDKGKFIIKPDLHPQPLCRQLKWYLIFLLWELNVTKRAHYQKVPLNRKYRFRCRKRTSEGYKCTLANTNK